MNHPRRFLTPGASNINKRKVEFDGFIKPAPPTKILKSAHLKPSFGPPPSSPKKDPEPASNNHLLAGYLAHEFLSQGTLFGEKWDPARAKAIPVSAAAGAAKKRGGSEEKPKSTDFEPPTPTPSSNAAEVKKVENQKRYVEVASLMNTDGAHIPGIVNPTQLARFLHL